MALDVLCEQFDRLPLIAAAASARQRASGVHSKLAPRRASTACARADTTRVAHARSRPSWPRSTSGALIDKFEQHDDWRPRARALAAAFRASACLRASPSGETMADGCFFLVFFADASSSSSLAVAAVAAVAVAVEARWRLVDKSHVSSNFSLASAPARAYALAAVSHRF